MSRGGILSAEKTLGDGKEHRLFFRAKTPMEVSVFSGAELRWQNTGDEAMREREKRRAAFIASSLCDESGSPLMSEEEALQIPSTLKPELCSMVIKGSSETAADVKKSSG